MGGGGVTTGEDTIGAGICAAAAGALTLGTLLGAAGSGSAGGCGLLQDDQTSAQQARPIRCFIRTAYKIQSPLFEPGLRCDAGSTDLIQRQTAMTMWI